MPGPTKPKPPQAPAGVPKDLDGTAPTPEMIAALEAGRPPQGRVGAPPPARPAAAPAAAAKIAQAVEAAVDVATAPARGLVVPTRKTPGIAAPRDGSFKMPVARQVHAAEVAPELFPVESPDYPGVYVDPDTNEAVIPPTNNKPQYSAMLLKVKNRLLGSGSPVREIVVPVHMLPQDYPLKKTEYVVERIEVVFDDEQMMKKYLVRSGAPRKPEPLPFNDVTDPLDALKLIAQRG